MRGAAPRAGLVRLRRPIDRVAEIIQAPRFSGLLEVDGKEVGLMAKFNPLQFGHEVRQEVSKVTWPTRKEVWITTLAVLVMVAVASIFFLMTDQLLGWLVSLVLGFGR